MTKFANYKLRPAYPRDLLQKLIFLFDQLDTVRHLATLHWKHRATDRTLDYCRCGESWPCNTRLEFYGIYEQYKQYSNTEKRNGKRTQTSN